MKWGANSANFVKNRARDTSLRSIYIPHFDQISVKISVFGVLYPCHCTDWVKFGTEEGPLLRGKFYPMGATCRPCGANKGEKPQNWPLSKLNTGALRCCAQCCRSAGKTTIQYRKIKHRDKNKIILQHLKIYQG